MKKCFLSAIIFLVFSILFFSCIDIANNDEEERTSLQRDFKSGKECLEKTFGGTYTNERIIVPDELTPYDKNELEDYTFYKYYSSNLQKDVVVADYLGTYTDGQHYHHFYTNYLFVKYGNIYEEQMKKMIDSDFSEVEIKCDFDWIFTSDLPVNMSGNQFLKIESRSLLDMNIYYYITLSETELSDYEKRLKSVAYKLSSYCSKESEVPYVYGYSPFVSSRNLEHAGFYFYLSSGTSTSELSEAFKKRYVLYKSSITLKEEEE